jgi:catechol-2,3-dioxygenase
MLESSGLCLALSMQRGTGLAWSRGQFQAMSFEFVLCQQGVSEALDLRIPDGHGVELYWNQPRAQ